MTEFTSAGIRNAVESINKKAPGKDDITGEIFKQAFETFPKYTTAMYNECFGMEFFQRWKHAKLIPTVKHDKENSEVTKFRTINLLNIEGKIMEKILITRIKYWAYINFLNNNQYGFTPQRSTIDATMAIKNIVDEDLKTGGYYTRKFRHSNRF